MIYKFFENKQLMNYYLEQLIQSKLDIYHDKEKFIRDLGPNYATEINRIAKKIYCANCNRSINKYCDASILYLHYLIEIRDLFDLLKIKEDIDKIFLFEYLLLNGYFSLNKSFSIDAPLINDILPFEGINVILGSGVCRNISSLFYELFPDTDLFHGTLDHIEQPDILIKCPPSHVINLINYHDTIVGYDLTNSLFFNFLSPQMMRSESDPRYYLFYKSFGDLFLSSKTITMIDEQFNNYVPTSYTQDDYLKHKVKALDIMLTKRKLLNSFYKKTNGTKEAIKEKMLWKK